MFGVAVRDVNFKQSIGIQISKVFYVVSLLWIGLSAIGGLIAGIYLGAVMFAPGSFDWSDIYLQAVFPPYETFMDGNPAGGAFVIVLSFLVVAFATIIGLLVSRYVFEWYNAVIHTAENTKHQH